MTPPRPTEPGVSPDEVTLLGLVSDILRRPRLLVGSCLIVTILTLVVGRWLAGYAATATFTPRAGSADRSVAAGLAAQFGITLGAGETEDSPDFYVALLGSQEILKQTVLTTYHFAKTSGGADSVSGDLIEVFQVRSSWKYRLHLRPATPQNELLDAIAGLAKKISASTDPTSGIVTLVVTTGWPALSEQVSARLLELVNQFNLERRQSAATAQRAFVERRMKEAYNELQDAEKEMAEFLSENRTYQDSPRLTFLANQLQRKLDLRQGVYTTLAQSYEQSRIEEVRDIPVITIIDRPEDSSKSTFRLFLLLVLGLFAGTVLGIGLALVLTYVGRLRGERPEEYATVVQLGRSALADLSPLRLYRKVAVRRGGLGGR